MGNRRTARRREKRYETTLKVGSLANLALVASFSASFAAARSPLPPPEHAGSRRTGEWTWSGSWR